MINEMALILILGIFRFLMVMFLVRHPMMFIFLNLLVSGVSSHVDEFKGRFL